MIELCRSIMEEIQNAVANSLLAMFPMLSEEVVLQSVTDPVNCYDPVTEVTLLNRCMDDLLSRDTSQEEDASQQDGPAFIDLTQSQSDEDVSIPLPSQEQSGTKESGTLATASVAAENVIWVDFPDRTKTVGPNSQVGTVYSPENAKRILVPTTLNTDMSNSTQTSLLGKEDGPINVEAPSQGVVETMSKTGSKNTSGSSADHKDPVEIMEKIDKILTAADVSCTSLHTTQQGVVTTATRALTTTTASSASTITTTAAFTSSITPAESQRHSGSSKVPSAFLHKVVSAFDPVEKNTTPAPAMSVGTATANSGSCVMNSSNKSSYDITQSSTHGVHQKNGIQLNAASSPAYHTGTTHNLIANGSVMAGSNTSSPGFVNHVPSTAVMSTSTSHGTTSSKTVRELIEERKRVIPATLSRAPSDDGLPVIRLSGDHTTAPPVANSAPAQPKRFNNFINSNSRVIVMPKTSTGILPKPSVLAAAPKTAPLHIAPKPSTATLPTGNLGLPVPQPTRQHLEDKITNVLNNTNRLTAKITQAAPVVINVSKNNVLHGNPKVTVQNPVPLQIRNLAPQPPKLNQFPLPGGILQQNPPTFAPNPAVGVRNAQLGVNLLIPPAANPAQPALQQIFPPPMAPIVPPAPPLLAPAGLHPVALPAPIVPGPVPNQGTVLLPTHADVLDDDQMITNLQLDEVLKLFPNASSDFVRTKLVEYRQTGDPVNYTCNYLLENPDFPKKADTAPSTSKEKKPSIDYIKDWQKIGYVQNHHTYFEQGLDLLSNEFTKLSRASLRLVMQSLFKGCYAKTKKVVDDAIKSSPRVQQLMQDNSRGSSFPVQGDNGRKVEIRLLKKARHPTRMTTTMLHPQLQKEVDFYRELLKTESEKTDFEMALRLNEDQYEKEGQLIECGCCFLETTFENMVQCLEGHLFCQTCLQQYTKEAVFGQGKAKLTCLEDGCDSVFPRSQLEKTLSNNILAKYDERVGEESIQLAEMANLVRCPSCNYAAVLDEDHKVFSCPECFKETCRDCKEPWRDHFGLACDEVKKQSRMRLTYQERMTEAKVRTCYKCGTKFTKSEGCNKMTCRCGATMCYICRQPIKDYSHFDNRGMPPPGQRIAVRPGEKCRLWTNADEDDDRAIKEIEKEMKREEKALREKSSTSDLKRPGEDGDVAGAKRPRTS